jgi:hypothetical protein
MQCCYLPNAWGAGAINVQNPADLQQIPQGNFASGFSGVDPSLNRYAGAGAYQISGIQIQTNGSNSAYVNDNGMVLPVLVSGASLSLDSSTGRGTATLINNGLQTNWVYYVTSANELTFLEIDPLTKPGANLVLQTMLKQATSAFDDTYLNGVGVVRTSGLARSGMQKGRLQSSGGTTDVVLGLFTGDGAGNGSVSLDENNGGTLTQQTTTSGQYSVSANGLVVLTGFGNGTPPLFFLANKNEAFVLGQDSSVASGFLVPQANVTFSNASATGAYWGGNYMPVTMQVTDSVVWSFADGNGNLKGTINYSGLGGTGSKNFTNTYLIDSTGRMTLKDGQGNLVDILYIISPTRVAFLPFQATDTDPSVSVYGSTN